MGLIRKPNFTCIPWGKGKITEDLIDTEKVDPAANELCVHFTTCPFSLDIPACDGLGA